MQGLRRIKIGGLFFLWVMSSCVWASAQSIDIGELVREGGREVIPVAIVADDMKVENLAKRAFRTHGGYKVVGEEEASFIFSFNQMGTPKGKVSIASGKPRKEQWEDTVRENDWVWATLQGSDQLVKKTSGVTGFFSGKVAFVGERGGKKEIYVSDPFFMRTQQLTRDGSDSISPKWSPKGDKILYTGYFRTGFPDIFMIDVATMRRTPFATFKGTNNGGVFSPNGQRVAMTLSAEHSPELFVSDNKGKQMKRLTHNKSVEASPTWSPDGRTILFTSDLLGYPQLYTIGVQGGQPKRVPTNISRYCAEGSWNPKNADQIAFTAAVNKSFQIALYDEAKNESRFLTKLDGDAIEPYWTDDGRHLIFTHRRKGDTRICVLDTETGKISPLHSSNFGKASQASFVRS